MAAKHTPGPWRVEAQTTLEWGNCNPDDHSTHGMGYPIAEARINPSGNWSTGPYADEGDANARLIAAAPDMLEALRPRLNAKARDLLEETIEAERAVGDPKVATAIELLLQWQEAAAIVLAKVEGRTDD